MNDDFDDDIDNVDNIDNDVNADDSTTVQSAAGLNSEVRPTIYICANGPLLIRGGVDIVEVGGVAVESSRHTIALCRCGASTIKPYCDGSHKLVGFHPDYPEQPN